MEHTKGNWAIGATDDKMTFVNSNGGICVCKCDGGSHKEDAKLIAAAPDLLNACRQLMYALLNNDKVELTNGKVSALEAIKKATE